MDAFAGGAAALGRRIAAGEADPVDLAEAALEAIGAHEAGDRIYVSTLPERARAEAEAARGRARAGTRRGPLDGVPMSWKDLYDLAGTPTRAGSRITGEGPAARDCTAARNASAAGWVALGKTHLSELAFSGLGINPRAATAPNVHGGHLAPGGSSSGAAASVALGLAAGGVGSDTGGSVRLPAAWNDLVGFKPGHGSIPMEGAVPLVAALDTCGPLVRTVEDAALMWADLAAVRAPDLAADASGLRLAVLETIALDDLEDAPARAFEDALAALERAGAHIERLAFEGLHDLAGLAGPVYAGAAWGVWGERIDARPDTLWPEIEARIRSGERTSAADHARAWAALERLRAAWSEAAAPFDAVICPTSPIGPPEVAPLIESAEGGDGGAAYRAANLAALRNTRMGNMLGLAGLSLPTGTPSCGLLINGPAGADGQLLRIAAAAERAL